MGNQNNCWLKGCCDRQCPNGICLKYYKLNYLYDLANVAPYRRRYVELVHEKGVDTNEFAALKMMRDDIINFVNDGRQLYLHSQQAGNGKTSWALQLLQSYFNAIWERSALRCKALFINVPMFLIELKHSISEKSEYIENIMNNVKTCDLVIWDDIGTKSATSFEHENLLSIIDARINNGKANIFTSNLSDEELHNVLGDRLASRICNLDENICLHGGDKRGLDLTMLSNKK